MRQLRPSGLALCLLMPLWLAAAGPASSEPSRPTLGPMGDRDLSIANHSDRTVVELYVSPQSADAWGQDLLGDDVLDPGQATKLKLGRMRECGFDVLIVYDDTTREENRGVNVCHTHEVAFDGSKASAPAEPPRPSRSVTVVDASPLPIQQLFLSPPDAAQWGDDRLAQASISVGETRKLNFSGDCSADVRVVFANRAAEERRGVDLCAQPVLRIAPGWTTQDAPATP